MYNKYILVYFHRKCLQINYYQSEKFRISLGKKKFENNGPSMLNCMYFVCILTFEKTRPCATAKCQ